MSEMIVTIADIRATGATCMAGSRRWALENGVDWNEFRKNGLPITFFKKFDHALIQLVLVQTQKRYDAAANTEVTA